jgi:hypothetical protein
MGFSVNVPIHDAFLAQAKYSADGISQLSPLLLRSRFFHKRGKKRRPAPVFRTMSGVVILSKPP